jgi:CRP-like cAMP-binding protein
MRFTRPSQDFADLNRVSLFRECTSRELRLIDGLATRVEVPAGRVLCEEGEIGSEFCLIVRGSAYVERAGRRVAQLGPGETFGEVALLARNALSRRMATVVAAERTRIAVFSRAEFNSMLDSVPTVTRRLLDRLSSLVVSLAAENARFGESGFGETLAPAFADPHDDVIVIAR